MSEESLVVSGKTENRLNMVDGLDFKSSEDKELLVMSEVFLLSELTEFRLEAVREELVHVARHPVGRIPKLNKELILKRNETFLAMFRPTFEG